MRRVVVLSALLLAVGCRPAVTIRPLLPAPYDVGAERKVTLEVDAASGSGIDTLDRAGGEIDHPGLPVPEVEQQLSRELRSTGYFTAAPPDSADLVFHVHVTAFQVKVWSGDSAKSDRTLESVMQAKLVVSKRNGEAVATRFYTAQAKQWLLSGANAGDLKGTMVRDTSADLVRKIVHDFVPVADERRVELEDAPEVKGAVELITRGQLDQARAALEEVLTRTPGSAAAHYNLGLIDEAESDFPAAARHFQEAQRLSPRPLYAAALERVKGLRKVR